MNDDRLAKAETIEDLFTAWRWEVYTDDEGNVVNIDFLGEKFGDDHILFEAIAPFVKDGSYIVMIGEDYDIWRWYFQDGKVVEQAGMITFKE